MKGFILWYDEMGDDGILCDLAGNEFYFNSWSFSGTCYQVTGKCKRTGRRKTILTRYFPGLFLGYKQIKDTETWRLKTDTPVTFVQAKGIDQPWAVKITIDESIIAEVMAARLRGAIRGLKAVNADPIAHRRKTWLGYQQRRVREYRTKLAFALRSKRK